MADDKTTQKQKMADILHIGIDLGTSRSAIAASNGQRQWTHSYVGWPKDFIARKVLKRDILFGQDALDHNLSVNLVRPLEHGVIRDGTRLGEESVRRLIHHLIQLVGPTKDQRVLAAVGVPAEALRVNKVAIRDAVREYADTLMIVSEPFAVAYNLGALDNAVVVDIGAGTIDFCAMHGTMPTEEDQRSLKSAGDYVDKQLFDLMKEKFPQSAFTETNVRLFKEQFGFTGKASKKVKVSLPIAGKFSQHDITAELKQACEGLVPIIAETLIDLISKYDPSYQEKVRKHVHLAGGGSQTKNIEASLTEALSEYGTFRVSTVEDPLYSGAQGALELAQDMPMEYWEDM